MADTGFQSRRIFGVIDTKLCQRFPWHRTSPVSSNEPHFSVFYPVAPLFRLCGSRCATSPYAVMGGCCRPVFVSADLFAVVPRRKRLSAGGSVGYGSIARLLIVWLSTSVFQFACHNRRRFSTTEIRHALSSSKAMKSKVTTPIPMGAFFRNEGGRNTPFLPRMEEETQGVTPSFKEEVAWGSGWFPSPP